MIRIGGKVQQDPAKHLLTINEEFTVSLCIARCQETAAGTQRPRTGFLPLRVKATRIAASGPGLLAAAVNRHASLLVVEWIKWWSA
jgi:hypothetical protein